MVPKEVLIQVKEVQVAQVVKEVLAAQVVQEDKACPPAWGPQAVNSSTEVPLLKVCPLAWTLIKDNQLPTLVTYLVVIL